MQLGAGGKTAGARLAAAATVGSLIIGRSPLADELDEAAADERASGGGCFCWGTVGLRQLAKVRTASKSRLRLSCRAADSNGFVGGRDTIRAQSLSYTGLSLVSFTNSMPITKVSVAITIGYQRPL